MNDGRPLFPEAGHEPPVSTQVTKWPDLPSQVGNHRHRDSMITGHGEMGLAIKSLKFEATDFITKPIHPDTLEIALKRAEDRISLRRQLREYTENLEEMVAEKTRKLIDAERLAAVGQTVAGLSHAIKNIASGLGSGAFVLEKGIELEEKKYLNQGWQMVKNNVDKRKVKHEFKCRW